jgi:hypothetical protein
LCAQAGDVESPSLHRRVYCEPDFPLVMTAGHEFYKKLTCPKAEHVVRSVDGGEAHCKIEFDWLDGVFKAM